MEKIVDKLKQTWKILETHSRFLPWILLFTFCISFSLIFFSGWYILYRYVNTKKLKSKIEPQQVLQKIKPHGYYPQFSKPKKKEKWQSLFLRLGQPDERVNNLIKAFWENKKIGRTKTSDLITLFGNKYDGSLDSLEITRKDGKIYRAYRTNYGWLLQELKTKKNITETAFVCTLKTRMNPMLKEKYKHPYFIKQAIKVWVRSIGTRRCRRKGTIFSFLISENVLPGGRRQYKKLLWSKANIVEKTYQLAFFPDNLRKEKMEEEDRDSLPDIPQEVGDGLYYTENGKCLHRIALGIPVRYKYISSKFTRRRFHPILKRYLPHYAVDLVARRGTPVRASGSGTVILRGKYGGNGKMVVIKHIPGVFTYYSHLSKFSKRVKKGSKVRRGRIIGFVGSTGLSTGCHLDYRLKVNGKYIHPLKNRLINFPQLTEQEIAKWPYLLQKYRHRFESLMNKEKEEHNGTSPSKIE